MKVFISFADSRLDAVTERIRKQAEAMGYWDEVKAYNEGCFDEAWKQKWSSVLTASVRGYGYWVWKPYIVRRELERLNEGDQLWYLDAGCHLNVRGIERMREYGVLLDNADSGILAFSIAYVEKEWTKGDVFEYFGVMDRKEITDTHQIQGGIFGLRKCEKTMQFVREWEKCWEDDFSLVDDSPSRVPNFPGFKEGRHDQSLFSCLCKMYGAVLLSAEEVEPPVGVEKNWDSWSALKLQPILAMRDRHVNDKLLKKIQRYKFIAKLPLGGFSRKYRAKLEKIYYCNPGMWTSMPYEAQPES